MNKFKCILGLHSYEVLKEEDFKDLRDNIIGKVIICRCTNCGRIKAYTIKTMTSLY